ncbi:hypothetical protein SCACP_09150 [Sporomusa carbonis]
MERYLTVSSAKIASKGIASVAARVINLAELAKDLSIFTMKEAGAEFRKEALLARLSLLRGCSESAREIEDMECWLRKQEI